MAGSADSALMQQFQVQKVGGGWGRRCSVVQAPLLAHLVCRRKNARHHDMGGPANTQPAPQFSAAFHSRTKPKPSAQAPAIVVSFARPGPHGKPPQAGKDVQVGACCDWCVLCSLLAAHGALHC